MIENLAYLGMFILRMPSITGEESVGHDSSNLNKDKRTVPIAVGWWVKMSAYEGDSSPSFPVLSRCKHHTFSILLL
jgi:hypothetical protein